MTKLNHPAPPPLVSTDKQGPTDPQELEAFIDKFFLQLKDGNIPGAVFVLVKDGKIFFSKGYGYANLEQKTPVIPDKTLFRLGSISKVFTATAVMQLAEQGKLNLNEDIDHYLKQFHIQNNQFKPITSAHLLTHTDGFDVAWSIGAATRCQSQLPSLEEFLSKNLPKRVRQPGELYVYGDVGIGLAGYLVEVLSKVSFTEYINQNIFKPLDMRHSSFQQPLPTALAPDLAVGYSYRKNAYIQSPFTCAKSVPSAGMSATATDVAHFMIAQLQGGRYGNARILKESTVQEMQRQHFTNFPNHNNMAGSAYGFYERFQNDQRALEHGGSIYGYTSQIFMLPEQNLGFFVAFNQEDKLGLREYLMTEFLDRYYPQQKSKTGLPKTHISAEYQRIKQIEGNYRFIRYPQDSFAKLWIVCFGSQPDVRLKTSRDGTVTLLPRGSQWREIEPWFLQYESGDSYLIFRRDAQGKITTMSLSNYVFVTHEKLAWYETIDVQKWLLLFSLLIFLSVFCLWLINLLIQRWRKRSSHVSRRTRIVQLLMPLISGLNLFFLLGIVLVVLQINYWEFFFGMPVAMNALLYLPILTTGLTTTLPIIGLTAWKDKSWSIAGRLHYLLTILASGIFILLLNYWSLLGFRF
ncbi:beta-lactamase family protein [Brasilonema sp. CT11]|nr:beta-lactamase family protein [Brasilonema sp. CT11]